MIKITNNFSVEKYYVFLFLHKYLDLSREASKTTNYTPFYGNIRSKNHFKPFWILEENFLLSTYLGVWSYGQWFWTILLRQKYWGFWPMILEPFFCFPDDCHASLPSFYYQLSGSNAYLSLLCILILTWGDIWLAVLRLLHRKLTGKFQHQHQL